MKKVLDFDNYYLTGLIEGDGTIYVPKTERCLKTNRILYPSIEIIFNEKDLDLAQNLNVSCVFEIDQRIVDISGIYCEKFMKEIGDFLKINLHTTKRGRYTLKASSIQSKEIIINYFTKYPLKGSKFLDYLDWLKVINIENKKDNLDKIRLIKSQMNSKRP